ncbi:MAG: HAD family hydrolase [Clostridiales bacterium]|nr:HAD family hydrolase [Clostridiales bacterium]
MYKNYIFDFYGTLADIRTDEENPYLWQKMSEIYCAMGAKYNPQQLQHTFRKLENKEKGLEENAEPDLTKVFSMLYQEKGVKCDAALAKLTAITFRALSREYIRVYDGVKEFLEELRQRGKGVYLLSNAQSDFTRPEIEMLGLTKYFDGIFISSEQGCKKPSIRFFSKLLEQYGLEAKESIMIGNDEAADIAGAKSVGMATLYIHTAISPAEYGKIKADYRVMDGDFKKIRGYIL